MATDISKLKYHLEDSISLGYDFIDKLEHEYQESPREKNSELLTKFYRLQQDWVNQVKAGLPNMARQKAFELAKSSDPTYETNKNPQVQNLVKDFRAKIIKLEEFLQDEKQGISLNVSGAQSRAYVNSTDNSTNIITDQFQSLVGQVELEFKHKYNGSDKKELLKLINQLKKEDNNPNKAREILGTLLSRGAELAQIGSLIAQLLTIMR